VSALSVRRKVLNGDMEYVCVVPRVARYVNIASLILPCAATGWVGGVATSAHPATATVKVNEVSVVRMPHHVR
jgi:hypothetical protein